MATTEMAHTSSTMSTIRPPVVTGFGICELTVVSWAETQKSAPPIVVNPEAGSSCSNRYISTVPTTSSSSVATNSPVRRLRSIACACVSAVRIMRSSFRMFRNPGSDTDAGPGVSDMPATYAPQRPERRSRPLPECRLTGFG